MTNRRWLVALLVMGFLFGGTPAAATTPTDVFPGVYLTRLTNLVIGANVPLPFDTALAANATYGSWSSAAPTRIVVTRTGWYRVGGDFTTLGASYGGPCNDDWVAQIERNGLDLAHAIVAERHDHSSCYSADLMSIESPVYLAAGDWLSVIFQNMNGGSLLIESNPSVPPSSGYDYSHQPGTGAMSPHLYIVFEGVAP